MQEPFTDSQGREWEIDDDGRMSRFGQITFPTYSASGGLSTKGVSYYLVDKEKGLIKAVEVSICR